MCYIVVQVEKLRDHHEAHAVLHQFARIWHLRDENESGQVEGTGTDIATEIMSAEDQAPNLANS